MGFLEENKCRVLGAKKWGKPLIIHELCEDLIKEDIFGYQMLV